MGNSSKNDSSTSLSQMQMDTIPSTDANLGQSTINSALQANLLTEQSAQKHANTAKNPAQPSDGLAVAGLFFAVGLYLSFFPMDARTPSVQGLLQFLAYCCYAIGFLGGSFELSRLSKNDFFGTFGLGVLACFIAFGLHFLADISRPIPIVSIILRLLIVLPVAVSGYGVVRGIIYLLIKDEGKALSSTQQSQISQIANADATAKGRLTPEQKAGIIVATLSVTTALIQSFPAVLPVIKQLLHIP